MLNSFTYNGRPSEDFGIRIERFPNLNRSQRKFKSTSVPGRNGNIYQLEDAWEEATVSYQIFAGSRHKGCAVPSFTEIMEWLHSADDYAELSDSYDPDHYRLAVFVDATDIESSWHQFGRATIKFRCRPQRYIAGTTKMVEDGDVVINPTNHKAEPVIRLIGNGAKSRFNLDGWTMSEEPLVTGTHQLYTLIKEGKKTFWVWPNLDNTHIRYIGGDDSQMSLDNATGKVQATSTDSERGLGFILTRCIPNADYTISANADSGDSSKIRIWFAASGGFNDIIGMEEATPTSGKIEHTFHTPAECGYVLIAFFCEDYLLIKFTDVMLTTGTEAKTFRAYGTPIDTTFAIGDVALKMTVDGYDEAVIDCERENLTIDGAEQNGIASIVDQFGNPSAEYLHLKKGENEVSFSGDIDSVVLDPRFWEL